MKKIKLVIACKPSVEIEIHREVQEIRPEKETGEKSLRAVLSRVDVMIPVGKSQLN